MQGVDALAHALVGVILHRRSYGNAIITASKTRTSFGKLRVECMVPWDLAQAALRLVQVTPTQEIALVCDMDNPWYMRLRQPPTYRSERWNPCL